jgi:nicotinate phosphoribosyltransferase
VIGAVYKLVWFDGDAEFPSRIKLAGGKSTWPGRKQVYRMDGFARDIIALDSEAAPEGGRALLQPIVVDGKRVMPEASVHEIRQRAMASLDALPDNLRQLTPEVPYRVAMSDALLGLREETIARYEAQVEQGA